MRSWGCEVEMRNTSMRVVVKQIRIMSKKFFEDVQDPAIALERYTIDLKEHVLIGPLYLDEIEAITQLSTRLWPGHPERFKPLIEKTPTLYGTKLGISESVAAGNHQESSHFILSADHQIFYTNNAKIKVMIPELISVPFPSFLSTEKNTVPLQELIKEWATEYARAFGGTLASQFPTTMWLNTPGRFYDIREFKIHPLPFTISCIDDLYPEWEIVFVPECIQIGFRTLKSEKSLIEYSTFFADARNQKSFPGIQLTGSVDITHFCPPFSHPFQNLSEIAMSNIYALAKSNYSERELLLFYRARGLPPALCCQLMPLGVVYNPQVYSPAQYRIGVLGLVRFVILVLAKGIELKSGHVKNFFCFFLKSSLIKVIKLYFVQGDQNAYDHFVLHAQFIQLMIQGLDVHGEPNTPLDSICARLFKFWYGMGYGTWEETQSRYQQIGPLSVEDLIKAIMFSCLSEQAKHMHVFIGDHALKWKLLLDTVKCFDDERLGIDISPGRGCIKMEFRDIYPSPDVLKKAPSLWNHLSNNIWQHPFPFDPDESIRVDEFGRSFAQYKEIGETHPFPPQEPLRRW